MDHGRPARLLLHGCRVRRGVQLLLQPDRIAALPASDDGNRRGVHRARRRARVVGRRVLRERAPVRRLEAPGVAPRAAARPARREPGRRGGTPTTLLAAAGPVGGGRAVRLRRVVLRRDPPARDQGRRPLPHDVPGDPAEVARPGGRPRRARPRPEPAALLRHERVPAERADRRPRVPRRVLRPLPRARLAPLLPATPRPDARAGEPRSAAGVPAPEPPGQLRSARAADVVRRAVRRLERPAPKAGPAGALLDVGAARREPRARRGGLGPRASRGAAPAGGDRRAVPHGDPGVRGVRVRRLAGRHGAASLRVPRHVRPADRHRRRVGGGRGGAEKTLSRDRLDRAKSSG
jgi:hypothetical protein